jgi:hypothetical protein
MVFFASCEGYFMGEGVPMTISGDLTPDVNGYITICFSSSSSYPPTIGITTNLPYPYDKFDNSYSSHDEVSIRVPSGTKVHWTATVHKGYIHVDKSSSSSKVIIFWHYSYSVPN